MRDPIRILLVRLSHLGDVVHALAVFHALHEAYPRAEIAWAIQEEFAELVRPLPGLSRVIPFERRGGWRAWPRIARELRDFRPELCVDAQGNLKSAGVVLASRAPRRAGMARADWREPAGAVVLNEKAPPQAPGSRHAMDRMLGLARFVAPTAGTPRLDPVLDDAERAAGRAALAERLPRGEGAPVLLHVSSPEDVRSWSLARCAELVHLLGAHRRPVLVLGGPGEHASLRALAERVGEQPTVHHWTDQDGLRELARVFAAAAERDGRLVAVDTGPMHLAAACGLAVVALEGPQDAARTGPWPPAGHGPHRVLRAAESPDCAPCLARSCAHAEGPVCMERITAEEVEPLLED